MAWPPIADGDVWELAGLQWWCAYQVIVTLLPPEARVSFGVVASTLEARTGPKHPLSRTGSLNEVGPYVLGLHMPVVADVTRASQADIVLNRRRSSFFLIVYLMMTECHPQDILKKVP